MANIPVTTRFIGIADTVNLVEKKSSQINSETKPYTMQDIIDTVPASSGIVETIVPGTNISVDSTDPANPIVSASGAVWGGVTGTLSNQTDLQSVLDDKVIKNTPVTASTKAKITFDSKGLVTNGTNLVASDIPNIAQTQVTNLVTDLSNKQENLISGTNIKTINGDSVLGSGDLVVGGAPSFLESNIVDLTIWNNGKGDISTNTSFGEQALMLNTIGSFNSAFGINTLTDNTDGLGNTAIGAYSLKSNTSGSQNVAVGNVASFDNTTGSSNTACGAYSLRSNMTGTSNTAIGQNALYNNRVSGNTAVGFDALRSSTTASFNTALGYNSLKSNTAGSQNVAIGYSAGSTVTTGYGNVLLGHNVTGLPTGNTSISIGANSAVRTSGITIGSGSVSNFNNTIVIGTSAISTAANQIVIGSSSVPVGTVTTESLSSTKTWEIIINGVSHKILLA